MSESDTNSTSNRYGLVLAGGSGTRFWPLSRNSKPKQLLQLFDDETLIEKAVKRLEGFLPKENILILTNVAQEQAVREVLSDLPPENIVAEPEKRDTAPAIALGAGWIAARNPEATMFVLPADQLIRDEDGFREILLAAGEAAEQAGAIVTLGIKPSWPCPSYGYIERGPRARISGYENSIPVHEVVRFREKPNPDLATEFLEKGNFSWNAGIFIWTIATLVRELSQHCPELADFISELRKSSDFSATMSHQFPKLNKTSIDYALMENASRVLNIESDVGWDDVGNWISVAKYLPEDSDKNATRGTISQVDSRKNIVFSESGKQIALLGVDNLIVVETEDAILVANKKEADKIKHLVDELPDDLL
ncbi:MAG: mannose-1-phosphate guanylyltransferase [Verrucomicrobiales bacterium]|nr:mannose-1-phosphate guanylyltransferase [Verrucomicrobiales bacterium]